MIDNSGTSGAGWSTEIEGYFVDGLTLSDEDLANLEEDHKRAVQRIKGDMRYFRGEGSSND